MILIDTPRLQMRQFIETDANAVLEFNRHPDVTRFTGDAGVVNNMSEAENVIKNVWQAEYQQYGYGRYALIHKKDNKVIGFCGFKYLTDFGMPDLGYRMLPEYWRQGLGYECASAALDYGFKTLGFSKVFAMADVNNAGSHAILQKLKFDCLGPSHYHGHDVLTYEKLRT